MLESEAYDRERNLKREVFVVTNESYRRLMKANEVCTKAPSASKPTEVRINQASDMYSTFMLGCLVNTIDL